jgi:hypothetical protein
MTNGCPAIVSVVDRALLSGLAATRYPTLPLPLPDVELLNVTQDAGLCAVQLHDPPAVMFTVPVPAAAVSDALAGEIA